MQIRFLLLFCAGKCMISMLKMYVTVCTMTNESLEVCSFSDADHSRVNSLFVSMERLSIGECLANIIHHLQSPIDVAVCAPRCCNIIASAGYFKGH